jgi:Cell division protein CrgA
MPVSKSKRSRYTAPPPKNKPSSPLWVPVVMFTLLITGTMVIIVNYLGLLPGEQQNQYLLLGLVEITAGFVFATLYR